MYSYTKDNDKGGKSAKKNKKNVINKEINKMKTITSQTHKIGSYEINKVSLLCFNNKRYILGTLSTRTGEEDDTLSEKSHFDGSAHANRLHHPVLPLSST